MCACKLPISAGHTLAGVSSRELFVSQCQSYQREVFLSAPDGSLPFFSVQPMKEAFAEDDARNGMTFGSKKGKGESKGAASGTSLGDLTDSAKEVLDTATSKAKEALDLAMDVGKTAADALTKQAQQTAETLGEQAGKVGGYISDWVSSWQGKEGTKEDVKSGEL